MHCDAGPLPSSVVASGNSSSQSSWSPHSFESFAVGMLKVAFPVTDMSSGSVQSVSKTSTLASTGEVHSPSVWATHPS